MLKSEREWAILRMVYDAAAFASIHKQERPDFVLRRGLAGSFGVEVTEWYESQSDARVQNHPTYVRDLLGGGEHLHKDDLRTLAVVHVAIQDAQGVEKARDVPAILRQRPPMVDHFGELANVIGRKNEQLESYGTDLALEHVNLIVLDRTERPASATAATAFQIFLSRSCERLSRTLVFAKCSW